jgi:hypothetical protein
MLVIDLLKSHFTYNLEFLACEKKKRDTDTSFASAFIIRFYVFLCFQNYANYFAILKAAFGSKRRHPKVIVQRTLWAMLLI